MAISTPTLEPKSTSTPAAPVVCAECGSSDTRPSRQARSTDAERVQYGEHPFRCRVCGARFYSTAPLPLNPSKRHRSRATRLRDFWKHRRGVILQAVLFVLMLALFLLCLQYLTHDHPDATPN